MQTDLVDPTRLVQAQRRCADAGLDALLLTPGPDLRYFGYAALPLERLTCLVVPATGDPMVVVPRLEQPAAQDSALGATGVQVVAWEETDDPVALVTDLLPRGATRLGIDDRMWASRVLALRAALPGVELVLAGPVLRELRMRKSPAEVRALREAGAAIDAVHALVGEWLKAGRTEREVGADIANAIRLVGHATVDFVIVASGPNGASPHHEVSDRVIQLGDPVVVDIGGTMPTGYCSDSTRTYAVGEPEPGFLAAYAVLQQAQDAACEAVRPGVSAESVDAAAREVIAAAGYGELFVHRTGHGIGLETHEDPYIVAGNAEPLEPGMAFSVEPGIYHPGRFGARIEDIVVCTESGVERLNRRPRDLVVLED